MHRINDIYIRGQFGGSTSRQGAPPVNTHSNNTESHGFDQVDAFTSLQANSLHKQLTGQGCPDCPTSRALISVTYHEFASPGSQLAEIRITHPTKQVLAASYNNYEKSSSKWTIDV